MNYVAKTNKAKKNIRLQIVSDIDAGELLRRTRDEEIWEGLKIETDGTK